MNSIELKYKKLFVKGAYFVTIFVTTLAFFADYFLINKKSDAIIDAFFTIFTIVAYIFIFLKRDIKVSAIVLFWIATFIEVIYFLTHSIDYKIILMVLIPIIAIFVLPKRESIINLTLFYIVVILIFINAYIFDRDNELINTPTFMLTYLIANIFILTFGVFYYKSVNELINELKKSNEQKQFLLQEIHHRVKNNLNLISSILGLQLDRDDEFLKSNQQRIKSIALLHEIIYKKDYTKQNFKEYTASLAKQVIDIYNKEVDLKIDIIEVKLSLDSMVHLGIVLNELITNSLKHNLGKIKIEISFKRAKEGFILKYCDSSNLNIKELKRGFGTLLIELAVKDLEGEIKYLNNNNFCYIINLPNLKEEI